MRLVNVPPQLDSRIISRVKFLSDMRDRREWWVSRAFSLISLVGIVIAVQISVNEFSRTAFDQYVSLLFSDGSIVITVWQDLVYSLVESLPLVGITAILVFMLVLLKSINYGIKNHHSFIIR